MKSLKVCLIGYGRMGKEIEKFLAEYGCELTYLIKEEMKWDQAKLKNCDVAIEFSTPQAAFGNIQKCIQAGVPVVSGTTGWLENLTDIKTSLQENKDSAFLYGSNFSLGMNLFFKLNEYTSRLMQADSSYDLEIHETHHIKKLDKPSGTAISLAEDIISGRGNKLEWINDQEPEENQLLIRSYREPDVPGTHTVQYENEIDKISISHEAKSRKGFAIGAIQSAKWLIGKKGYYTVQDYVESKLIHLTKDE